MSLGIFLGAAALYFVSVILYQVFLVSTQVKFGAWAFRTFLGGWVLHALFLIAYIADSGSLPIATTFHSLVLYAWIVGIAFWVLEIRYGYGTWGAWVTPVILIGFLLGGLAILAPTGPARFLLLRPLLVAHVSSSFLAYGFFTLAFVSAMLYLAQDYILRQKRPTTLHYRLPPLEATENLGRILSALGLPCMTLALITGSMEAEQAWGTFWLWDPKLTLALVTWVIYMGYFYARNGLHWRGRRAAWLLVLGFVVVLITYMGSGVLFSTVHTS